MKLLTKPLNLLFPPQCALCREMIGQAGAICSDCWQKLNFISDPMCAHCGYPHEFEMGESAECAACIANAPAYHGHRSVLYFDGSSKKLVHDLKYYDNPIMLQSFARWMKNLAPEWLEIENTILTPIPIHPYRMLKRKYNQSALLTKALAKETGLNAQLNLLKRVKNRPPQASLPRAQRLKNLGGAFEVNPKHKELLRGRTIILIDDVMTTGATLNACAKRLKKAGSGRVYCLTLARTVLG